MNTQALTHDPQSAAPAKGERRRNATNLQLDLWKTQQRLIRSERLASVGEMTAAIVHEIKNPLTVVVGHLDMLLEEDPESRRLNIVRRQVEKIATLSESLLRYAGVPHDSSSYVNLNELVSDLRDLIAPVSHNVEVSVDMSPEVVNVIADGGQVEQVVMNLVLNAVDSMEMEGEHRLTITTGMSGINDSIDELGAEYDHAHLAMERDVEAMAGRYCYIEVKDSGEGIPGDRLEQLFGAFYTTKTGKNGTGLGLSIAKTIIGNWGGNIVIASTPGSGTCFRILLPVG